MATKKTITRRQFDMLESLSTAPAFLAASEYADAAALVAEGLVGITTAPLTVPGFRAWHITDKGRDVLQQLAEKGAAGVPRGKR